MSINQLAELTGKDRRTITTRCQGLPFEEGAKGAHLYDCPQALAAIYGAGSDGKTLDDARKELAIQQADLARTRVEELRRERIPIEVVKVIWDAALQAFGATLKAAKGKVLDSDKINELLEKLRKAKLPLKW